MRDVSFLAHECNEIVIEKGRSRVVTCLNVARVVPLRCPNARGAAVLSEEAKEIFRKFNTLII